ncbi:hypothetical protein ACRAVF_19215 [Bradyrhizobium oligotrophicum S58]
MRDLDELDLFSITIWRSERGYTVGVQKNAGDLVRYETRKTIAAAVDALFPVPQLPY